MLYRGGITMTKICAKCEMEKDISEYYKTRTGHVSKCRKCYAEYSAEYYRQNYYTKIAPQMRAAYRRRRDNAK